MDPVYYDFNVIIEPCQPTLTSVVQPQIMSYTLWDANISEPYQFDQTPSCHAEVVTITPPDASFTWLTANTGTSEIELNLAGTYDRSLIGTHTFTITKEVTYPDDYT